MTEDGGMQRLAVFGAGVMGVGITTLAVGRGVPVMLVDVDRARLDTARARVRSELRLAHMTGALPRTGPVGELELADSAMAAADATWVIEAVTEVADLKAKVHREIASVVAPGTLRVTNTSSIPVDELAGEVPAPEDLAGIHFMNPPYLIGTLEVVRGPRTGARAMTAVDALLARLGRKGIVVGDGPGFVTSRVLHRMINDAANVVEEGRATVEDVDALMEGCLGHPTGPLRTADLIGIDNLVDSLAVLHERTGDDSYRPSALLLRKVAEGDHGRKTGRGFYTYGPR
ncbi:MULTISPECIES: 3-hydroxyacyl-CoA dehydrogenase family protein [Streptomyces]|uniref:3-hydroxyacyl-CoA dehydrogenase family protein n=1 Tax=Streptomyces TaxID=1883 RepID=UPI00211A497F|nr:3-hydroxyacyl-CoA dehydrogenase family protein [Streptomyces hilarionis]MCQ9130957.1 3-hydroxyacyl-CoA dehydrogenase family protein [Streptomyces hilarionis]